MPRDASDEAVSRPISEIKAELFRALAHPIRVRVLELLSDGERSVGEMAPLVGAELSHLSQQLGVLRRTSLVVARREGGEVTYSISAPEVRDLLLSARRILSGLIRMDEEALSPGAVPR